MAWRLARPADVIHLHLPQFDAPGVALRGRLLGKPVVLTYHCDLQLPHGLFNRLVDRVVSGMNLAAGALADAVVTYTRDYAIHSPYLLRYVDQKLAIIPPPVVLSEASEAAVQRFRANHRLNGHEVIGFSGRLATEKGIEVLLSALPIVLEAFPRARVLHAGPYKDIIGEEAYAARLAPLFKQYEEQYKLLGFLSGEEFMAFYRNLDVLCICSLNSTESFGMVQIEAMGNGVPVAACNLPGVRQPVTMTGMGEVTAVGDHQALAAAIIRILQQRERYAPDPQTSQAIARTFSPEQTAAEYVRLFADLCQGKRLGKTEEPGAYERLREMQGSSGAEEQGWR
jgi:glycosyltransferase involved in cell wall biosynthesis